MLVSLRVSVPVGMHGIVSVPLLGQPAGSVTVQASIVRGYPDNTTPPPSMITLWPEAATSNTDPTPVWLRAAPRVEQEVVVLETAAAVLELQASVNC